VDGPEPEHVTADADPDKEAEAPDYGPPPPLTGPGYLPSRSAEYLARFLLVVVVVAGFWIPVALHGMCWLSLLIGVGVAFVAFGFYYGVQRRFSRAVWATLILGVVCLAGLEVWNGIAFHTAALSGPPPVVLWCGTTFTADTVGGHQVALPGPALPTLQPPVEVGRLVAVGTTPSGLAIVSDVPCSPDRPHRVFVAAVHEGGYFPYRQVGLQLAGGASI
jgi:hypothetical protein